MPPADRDSRYDRFDYNYYNYRQSYRPHDHSGSNRYGRYSSPSSVGSEPVSPTHPPPNSNYRGKNFDPDYDPKKKTWDRSGRFRKKSSPPPARKDKDSTKDTDLTTKNTESTKDRGSIKDKEATKGHRDPVKDKDSIKGERDPVRDAHAPKKDTEPAKDKESTSDKESRKDLSKDKTVIRDKEQSTAPSSNHRHQLPQNDGANKRQRTIDGSSNKVKEETLEGQNETSALAPAAETYPSTISPRSSSQRSAILSLPTPQPAPEKETSTKSTARPSNLNSTPTKTPNSTIPSPGHSYVEKNDNDGSRICTSSSQETSKPLEPKTSSSATAVNSLHIALSGTAGGSALEPVPALSLEIQATNTAEDTSDDMDITPEPEQLAGLAAVSVTSSLHADNAQPPPSTTASAAPPLSTLSSGTQHPAIGSESASCLQAPSENALLSLSQSALGLSLSREITTLCGDSRKQQIRMDELLCKLEQEGKERHETSLRMIQLAQELQQERIMVFQKELESKRAEALAMLAKANQEIAQSREQVARANEERSQAREEMFKTRIELQQAQWRIKDLEQSVKVLEKR